MARISTKANMQQMQNETTRIRNEIGRLAGSVPM